jgi:hypothetical protein
MIIIGRKSVSLLFHQTADLEAFRYRAAARSMAGFTMVRS